MTTLNLLGRKVGLGEPLFLIAGPCVVESEELCLGVAQHLRGVADRLGILVVFKASFDKANRTSGQSFRGLGMDEGLRVLEKVRAETGLAVLRLDRLRALVDVYPGVEREDEMVAAFDYCLHGRGGAAPSIDTAMHGLVDAAHIDHLHPDSGIALATAADGEALTKECFGDRVAWVDWRRPGFQLGLDIAEIKRQNPDAIGCVLGGHGITAWGDTSAEAEANSLWIIQTAAAYIEEHSRPEPFGPALDGYAALPEAERRAKAAALVPTIRSIASQDRPMVGHSSATLSSI